jgi:hypothetical protein
MPQQDFFFVSLHCCCFAIIAKAGIIFRGVVVHLFVRIIKACWTRPSWEWLQVDTLLTLPEKRCSSIDYLVGSYGKLMGFRWTKAVWEFKVSRRH